VEQEEGIHVLRGRGDINPCGMIECPAVSPLAQKKCDFRRVKGRSVRFADKIK
jgi:hypothetical protein